MEAKRSDGILPGFSRNMVLTVKYSGGIIVSLLTVCLLLSVMTDPSCTVRSFSNIMRQISINMTLACGMATVIILGGIDLSAGSVVTVSGRLCYRLIINMGVPSIIATPISICTRTLMGVSNGSVISRTTIPPFIVILAMMNIGRRFIRIYTKATAILADDPLFIFIGGDKILRRVLTQFVYMLMVIAIPGLILNRTKSGGSTYAVGDNKQVASYSGVNSRRVTMTVFVIMGIFVSCAGILSSTRTFSAQFSVGEGSEMDAISAIVPGGTSMDGGVRHLGEVIIGYIVVGVLSNGMNILGIDSSWQYVIKGVVVLIAVFTDYIKKMKDQSLTGKDEICQLF